MSIKSEGFDDFFVIGNEKHKLLLKNLDVVINDWVEDACITELWINEIILAFEASGYRIVEDYELACHQKFGNTKETKLIWKDNSEMENRLPTKKELFEIRATTMRESETKWIYESPDGGKTIYRRSFGDHDTPREKIDRSQIPRVYDKTKESILR